MDQAALAINIQPGRITPVGERRAIRADHYTRYLWAGERLAGDTVLDAGCGCGYGAAYLAGISRWVWAVDMWADGIAFARTHYDRPNIEWLCADIAASALPSAQTVVAFEIVEHLREPRLFLDSPAVRSADRLLVSVPNEAMWPWQTRMYPVHHRHYRRGELEDLLAETGWVVTGWWGQATIAAEPTPGALDTSRTILAEAERAVLCR